MLVIGRSALKRCRRDGMVDLEHRTALERLRAGGSIVTVPSPACRLKTDSASMLLERRAYCQSLLAAAIDRWAGRHVRALAGSPSPAAGVSP